MLSSAGLVKATRHDQQLAYSLTTSVLADIVTELADMARINEAQSKTRPGRSARTVGESSS